MYRALDGSTAVHRLADAAALASQGDTIARAGSASRWHGPTRLPPRVLVGGSAKQAAPHPAIGNGFPPHRDGRQVRTSLLASRRDQSHTCLILLF